MKKIFCIILTLFMISLSANSANTFKADAKTKRIASGTQFDIEFLQNVTTSSAFDGDSFTAALKTELKTGSTVILPIGSVVRGSISTVKTAKRFSRGAKLYLDFYHVVTPNGRQIPLDLAVTSFDKIYYDGALYKNLGYGEAVKINYEKGADITKTVTEYGYNIKDDHPGLQYLTTPFCAVGGFFGGAGYFICDSVADMFRKGQDVYIKAGDILTVTLINPIDIPIY